MPTVERGINTFYFFGKMHFTEEYFFKIGGDLSLKLSLVASTA